MEAEPRFRQGVFPYRGNGYDKPMQIDPTMSYVVPPGAYAQPVYLRAGNSGSQLIYLLLLLDGEPLRYFPIGASSDSHVSLRVVQNVQPDSHLELMLAAPEDAEGTVVVDFGIMEVP